MDDSRGQCFVIQPFDNGVYDRLYEQVFKPAIEAAKLTPYRVDNDPGASIPIETIEEEIASSAACFGEISEDNPNVWFEVGYARACSKPLCLVSSTSRHKFPFDIQHRKVIQYPAQALPDDYTLLRKAITDRLSSAVEKDESRRQNVETVSSLSVVPETNGLATHELMALTLIFEEQYATGLLSHEISDRMSKAGYQRTAASLAIAGLSRKGLVDSRRIDFGDYWQDKFFVSGTGEEWLLTNQHVLNLRLPTTKTVTESLKTEISDDDIPF